MAMHKYRVKVPATTANMGSGFDSIGMALSMYNEVVLSYSDRLEIISLDKTPVPQDEHNLIYRTLAEVHRLCGRSLGGVSIAQKSPIPQARGLGSSSACIVAGVLGANALMGNILSAQDMIDISAKAEGHPDNSTPAILGGIVASAINAGRVYYSKLAVSKNLGCCAIYTENYIKTEVARSVLPSEVTLKAAVYNLSRSALLMASIATESYHNLRTACDDCLHQQYRLSMIPHYSEIVRECENLGAYASFISGAGSAIMALYDFNQQSFAENLTKSLLDNKIAATVKPLAVDNTGAVVDIC